MKSPHHMTSQDAETLAQAVSEEVSEAIEMHWRWKQPAAAAPQSRIVWLAPERAAPRAVPGDDEPLPEEIEL